MAEKIQPLLVLGPFAGLNTQQTDAYQSLEQGDVVQNGDSFRVNGAFSTARGRVEAITLDPTHAVTGLAHYTTDGGQSRYAIAATPTAVYAYNHDTKAHATIAGGLPFISSEEYGEVLYTDALQAYIPALTPGPPTVVPWQGPLTIGTFTTVPDTSTGAMAADSYIYAYTTTWTYDSLSGATQESQPTATADAPFTTFAATLSAQGEVTITPSLNWGGSLTSSLHWSTNIYRWSLAQPTFYLIATQSNADMDPYIDRDANITISAKRQLTYRSPLPNVPSATLPVVFGHQDRMCFWANVIDADTNNRIESQLWLSDVGLPWSFHADTQVYLTHNESDNATDPNAPYGDRPMAAVSLTSVAMLFKRKTLLMLEGVDVSSYTVVQTRQIGTVSGASVTHCEPEGMVCWLSDDGPWAFVGGVFQDIGEDIREQLRTFPASSWANACGWYRFKTWYLSFPDERVTFVYRIDKKAWRTLAYAAAVAYSVPSEPAPLPGAPFGLVVGARPGTSSLDYWSSSEQDLGNNLFAAWVSPRHDSGAFYARKYYRYLACNAPVQTPGAALDVTLSVWDFNAAAPATFLHTFDLAKGPYQCVSIPSDAGVSKGQSAQLQLILRNAINATSPASVEGVIVGGTATGEFFMVTD